MSSGNHVDEFPDEGRAKQLERLHRAVVNDESVGDDLSEAVADEGMADMLKLLHAEGQRRKVAPAELEETFVSPNDASTPRMGDGAGGDRLPFEQIGDYKVEAEIARGGMGAVFRARHTKLDRLVALKMMLAGPFATREEKDRFRVEAESAAQLDHPGIVPVFDVGEFHGQPYFSMGLIEGDSLAGQIREHPIAPTDAAELSQKIADAVAYAHSKGVLHRDIKPLNILIDQNGTPRLTDFGLARRTDADSGMTATGQVLGTPSYMSPEQAKGSVSDVDQSSDVYSIGATLYCMLVGQPPFQAATAVDTLRLVIEQEPPSPRQINALIPIDLETICLKCLRKEPQQRYQTAEELAEDLGRFLRNEPILARPTPVHERVRKWIKRRPVVAGLGSLVLIAVASLLIGGAWYQAKLVELLGEKTEETDRANREQEKAIGLLYESMTGEADFLSQTRPEGYGARVWDLLDRSRRLDTPQVSKDELRRIAIASLGGATFEEPIRIEGLPAHVTCSEIISDGKRLIVGFVDGNIHIYDLHDHRLLQKLSEHSKGTHNANAIKRLHKTDRGFISESVMARKVCRWQLDGTGVYQLEKTIMNDDVDRRIVAVSRSGQHIVSLSNLNKDAIKAYYYSYETGYARIVDHDDTVDFTKVGFSIRSAADASSAPVELPDSQYSEIFEASKQHFAAALPRSLPLGRERHSIHVWNLEDPSNHHRFETNCGYFTGVALSPTDEYVACSGDQGFQVFDLTDRKEIAGVAELDRCRVLSFTPDGEGLLLKAEMPKALVWYSLSQRRVLARFPFAAEGFENRFCADGSYLLRGGPDYIEILPVRPREIWSALARGSGGVFNADGRLLTACGHQARVFDVLTGERVGHVPSSGEAAYSPDGRFVAFRTFEGKVRLWNLLNGAQAAADASFPSSCYQIEFDPTGNLLAAASYLTGTKLWKVNDAPLGESYDYVLEQVLHDTAPGASVAFSPSGKRFAHCADSDVIVFEGPDWRKTHRIAGPRVRPDSLVFLDENRIALADYYQYVRVWGLDTGKELAVSADSVSSPITASPDRTMLLCGNVILDSSDLSPLAIIPLNGYCTANAWSPNGRSIVFSLPGGRIVTWNLSIVQQRLTDIDLQWDRFTFPTGTTSVSTEPFTESLRATLRKANFDQVRNQIWTELRRKPRLPEKIKPLVEMMIAETGVFPPFTVGGEDPDLLTARLSKLNHLGRALVREGLHDSGLAVFQAVKDYAAPFLPQHVPLISIVASAEHYLGVHYRNEADDLGPAIACFEREEALLEQLLRSGSEEYPSEKLAYQRFHLYHTWAYTCDRNKQRDQAIEHMKRAVECAIESQKAERRTTEAQLKSAQDKLVQWLTAAGRASEASALRNP